MVRLGRVGRLRGREEDTWLKQLGREEVMMDIYKSGKEKSKREKVKER